MFLSIRFSTYPSIRLCIYSSMYLSVFLSMHLICLRANVSANLDGLGVYEHRVYEHLRNTEIQEHQRGEASELTRCDCL